MLLETIGSWGDPSTDGMLAAAAAGFGSTVGSVDTAGSGAGAVAGAVAVAVAGAGAGAEIGIPEIKARVGVLVLLHETGRDEDEDTGSIMAVR